MKYKISKDVLWRKVDGEIVIVSENNGENCYLNPTGSEIWQMICEGMDFSGICSNLLKTYNAKRDDVEKDVQRVIDELVDSSLLVRLP